MSHTHEGRGRGELLPFYPSPLYATDSQQRTPDFSVKCKEIRRKTFSHRFVKTPGPDPTRDNLNDREVQPAYTYSSHHVDTSVLICNCPL